MGDSEGIPDEKVLLTLSFCVAFIKILLLKISIRNKKGHCETKVEMRKNGI